ncbi:MAG: hypothetical protein OEU92_12290 [Alphaproteobacteria bacterium]|nr:hypothetical protein [Alphaproteobacteria bacterium]
MFRKRGHNPAGVLALIDRDTLQIRNLQSVLNWALGKSQITTEQIEHQGVITESVAHLFKQIIGGAQLLDPKQRPSGLLRELLQVNFASGLGKILRRLAGGDDAQPSIFHC